MSFYKGSQASVRFGPINTVIQVRSWKLNRTSKLQDVTALGDTYDKEEPINKKWTASLEAIFDLGDTVGQLALDNAFENQTKATSLRLYLNDTVYWTPYRSDDPEAGCYITQVSPAQTQGGLAVVEFQVSGYGPGDWVGGGVASKSPSLSASASPSASPST